MFTDDKGNSLLEKQGFGGFEGFAWFRTNDKGDLATLDISGRKTPGPGASTLIIKGELVFQVASEQATYRQKAVTLQKDATFKAGPIAGKISKASKPDWGDEPLQVELTFKGELPPLAEVRFIDADGKQIESKDAGRSWTSGISVTTTLGYRKSCTAA